MEDQGVKLEKRPEETLAIDTAERPSAGSGRKEGPAGGGGQAQAEENPPQAHYYFGDCIGGGGRYSPLA